MNPAKMLLAAVMLFPEALEEAVGLGVTEADFFDAGDRQIWRAISVVRDEGTGVDYVTVGRALLSADMADLAYAVGIIFDADDLPANTDLRAQVPTLVASLRDIRRAARRKAAQ